MLLGVCWIAWRVHRHPFYYSSSLTYVPQKGDAAGTRGSLQNQNLKTFEIFRFSLLLFLMCMQLMVEQVCKIAKKKKKKVQVES